MSSEVSALAQSVAMRESDEDRALGYFQRLNMAGHDRKGQLSGAYGQAGIGLGLSITVDFGKAIAPFVTLKVKGDLSGERMAHALAVLQRVPRKAWDVDIVRPRPPAPDALRPAGPIVRQAIWRTETPLAMSFLRGKTYKLAAGVAGSAWAGIGSSADADETGLALGIDAEAGVGGTLTVLADPEARHFGASPYDSGLAEYVDDLFFDHLKARVAGWLLLNGAGTVAAIEEGGLPNERLEAVAAEVKSQLSTAATDAIKGFDTTAIPDPVKLKVRTGWALAKDLHAIGQRIKTAVKAFGPTRSLVTDDLLADLDAAGKAYDDWLDVLNGKVPERADERPADPAERRLLRAAARARKREAQELRAALERRQQAKAQPPARPFQPSFHLNIAVVEGRGKITAGAKASLQVLEGSAGAALQSARRAAGQEAEGDTITLAVSANAGAEADSKRIAVRWQSWAPGSGDRRLVSTQESVLTYMNWRLAASAGAAGQTAGAERANWVTMSYRAVSVSWFDDLEALNHQALPSGSGVSFGLSVLAPRLAVYQDECRKVGGDAALPADAMATEAALLNQLRVTKGELRRFMRGLPVDICYDLTAYDRALVVESGFAFTRPLALTIDDHRPTGLFDLAPARNLAARKAMGDAARLQIIRLRYRLGQDDERRRNVFALGWQETKEASAAEDSALRPDDARTAGMLERLKGAVKLPDWLKSAAQVLPGKLTMERIERVGSEGIVELHRELYPRPYDPDPPPKGLGPERAQRLEDYLDRQLAETWVPPVALFSQ